MWPPLLDLGNVKDFVLHTSVECVCITEDLRIRARHDIVAMAHRQDSPCTLRCRPVGPLEARQAWRDRKGSEPKARRSREARRQCRGRKLSLSIPAWQRQDAAAGCGGYSRRILGRGKRESLGESDSGNSSTMRAQGAS